MVHIIIIIGCITKCISEQISVQSVEVVQLCQNFHLTGLPDLSSQKHLVHHCIHLHTKQEDHMRPWPLQTSDAKRLWLQPLIALLLMLLAILHYIYRFITYINNNCSCLISDVWPTHCIGCITSVSQTLGNRKIIFFRKSLWYNCLLVQCCCLA